MMSRLVSRSLVVKQLLHSSPEAADPSLQPPLLTSWILTPPGDRALHPAASDFTIKVSRGQQRLPSPSADQLPPVQH
ncbi:hypothetical protein B5X24_HaOG212857 [Helicoverpa armigera]|uniref:Uncharacterized protein n=1 Tax=Helicoverpa armigera TaxID=29058 RepID=A0A2W1BFN8_HELAM|nr:hypothetical protein B5X24_HaOG212857 [Helicoverpa armigera]